MENKASVKERDEKGRFLPGNTASLRFGFYSKRQGLLSRKIKPAIRQAVTKAREKLIEDLGGEANLTAARAILLEKTINLYQLTLLIEQLIKQSGSVIGVKSNKALEFYLTLCREIRANLKELGFDRVEAIEKPLEPLEIAEIIDKEKKEKKGTIKTSDQPEIVEISGSDEADF